MYLIVLIVCEKGYIGFNCEVKCFFLFYGFYCLKNCNCIVKYCDFVNGCKWLIIGM